MAPHFPNPESSEPHALNPKPSDSPPPLCRRSPRSESAASGPDFLGGDSILELSHLGPGPALPLMRGISDITADSDGVHGMEVDVPTARWTATSAGLWPVRIP